MDITKDCIKSLDNRAIRNNFIIESNEVIINGNKDNLLEPFIKYNYNLEEKREEKISSLGLGLYLCSSLASVNNFIKNI